VFEEMLVVCAVIEGAAMRGMPIAKPLTIEKLGVTIVVLDTPVTEVTGRPCATPSSKTRSSATAPRWRRS